MEIIAAKCDYLTLLATQIWFEICIDLRVIPSVVFAAVSCELIGEFIYRSNVSHSSITPGHEIPCDPTWELNAMKALLPDCFLKVFFNFHLAKITVGCSSVLRTTTSKCSFSCRKCSLTNRGLQGWGFSSMQDLKYDLRFKVSQLVSTTPGMFKKFQRIILKHNWSLICQNFIL